MNAVRLLTLVAAVAGMTLGCFQGQVLSDPCGPPNTLVSPRGNELLVVDAAPEGLFWENSRSLWALKGRASSSGGGPVESSFLAEFIACSIGHDMSPTAEHRLAALDLYREAGRCVLEDQVQTIPGPVTAAVGLRSSGFCVATDSGASVVQGDTIAAALLRGTGGVQAVGTAGVNECVFIQPDAYTVGLNRTVFLSGDANLSASDIGGLSRIPNRPDPMPWQRVDSVDNSYVVQSALGAEVLVPTGAIFVAGLDQPTLLGIEAASLRLVRVPVPFRPGDDAIVDGLTTPNHVVRQIVTAQGIDDTLYALVEIELPNSGPKAPSASRKLAWIEIDVPQGRPPVAAVRMHISLRGSLESAFWFGEAGSVRLALVVDGRLGLASLDHGFCWVDAAVPQVTAAAGTARQLLVTGLVQGRIGTASIYPAETRFESGGASD